MSNECTYTARTADSKDFIILVSTDAKNKVCEEAFELYHEDDDVEFESLPYDVESVEFQVLNKELQRLRAELYGVQHELKAFPTFNKDCIQRVVQLNRSVKNRAGELFPQGTLMVITQRHKRSNEVTIRPLKGSIRVNEEDCDFLGDKVEFGFEQNQ